MEGSKITGIKDVDKLILNNMDTRTFLNTYQIKNKYIHSLFDENVFRNRIEKEFPRLVDSKGDRLWKKYYFDLVHWSEKLKEKYGFESNDFRAHPKIYFDILARLGKLKEPEHLKVIQDLIGMGFQSYKRGILNEILLRASRKGYIDLIKFAINNGADAYQRGIEAAAIAGQMEAFEYFRNNVPFDYDLNDALNSARLWESKNNTEMIEHIQTLIKNK